MGSNYVFWVWVGVRLFRGVPGSPGVPVASRWGRPLDGAQSSLYAALVNKGGQTLGGAVALLK